MQEYEEPSNPLADKLKGINGKLIDELVGSEELSELTATTKVTNTLRFSVVRILNEMLKQTAGDPKMLAQLRAYLSDIDKAVFMIARVSQEDKHLDNEEMVAKALNHLSKELRQNPYEERNRSMREANIEAEPTALPEFDGLEEFEFNEGCNEIGLIEGNYKDFQENIVPNLKVPEKAQETPDEETTGTIDRDAPLPPPAPGSLA